MIKLPPIIFAVKSYEYLLEKLLPLTGFDRGEIEFNQFPDGESYHRVLNTVRERKVILLGGTWDDHTTLELYDVASSIVMDGAKSLTLILPYFGYSTMERAVRAGEVVKAKTRARLISSIPQASIRNKVILMDLHTEGIPYYFERDLRTAHLYAKKVIVETCRRYGGQDFVLACTDAGRAKWVESLANDMGVQASFVFKRRISGEKTEITGVSAWVKDKDVIIYDDMIRTGGSMIKAAEAYLQAGARSIMGITTHGIFPGNSLEKMRASGHFRHLVATDSHPNAVALQNDFLEVVSLAPVFGEYLSEIF
ncbi:MAG: ribose-phosphate pyrophosphokinase [Bacteroidia bacterium]|nr:ribose-phosphate pyrophosphokinase [Bacteroidia bacterium]